MTKYKFTTLQEYKETENNITDALEELATEDWAGKWGNNPDSDQRLNEAGSSHVDVKKKVKEMSVGRLTLCLAFLDFGLKLRGYFVANLMPFRI